MKLKNKFINKKTAFALSAMLSSLVYAPAFSQTACQVGLANCNSIADPFARAQCSCQNSQIVKQCDNAAVVSNQWGRDPYADNMQKVVKNQNPNGQQIQSQTCNGLTSAVFNRMLSSAGSAFGLDLNRLLSGVSGNYSNSICQAVDSQIANRVNKSCPRTNIPGLPVNCNVNVGGGANGGTVGINGQIGGYQIGGNGQVSTNGVYSAGGGYDFGRTGSANGNVQGNSGGVTNSNRQVQGNTTGQVTNGANCWLSGNCSN